MTCERYSNQINDLVQNKLDERTADRVMLHLASCRRCEAEFENSLTGTDVYANFLVSIEPSKNFVMDFQAKLESEDQRSFSPNRHLAFREQLSNLFAFFRLNAASTAASILILLLLGFGFVALVEDRNNTREAQLLVIQENPSHISPKPDEVEVTQNAPFVFLKGPKNPKTVLPKKKFEKEIPQFIAVDLSTKRIGKRGHNILPKASDLSAEDLNQLAQIREWETDTARQIEKVEILLRAFRNARLIEETGRYDLDYEKQQARKLLQSNAGIKKRAERYGTLLDEQILNEVEPYLLDIANLDSDPTAEQILGIKNRFRSQQIISSLQEYSIR